MSTGRRKRKSTKRAQDWMPSWRLMSWRCPSMMPTCPWGMSLRKAAGHSLWKMRDQSEWIVM